MRSIWDSLFLGNRSLPREFNNVRSNLTYMNSTQGVFELTWMWLGMWCVGHYKRVLAIFGVNLSTTIVLQTHNMSLLYYNNKNLGYVITTTSMIDLDEIYEWNIALMFSFPSTSPWIFGGCGPCVASGLHIMQWVEKENLWSVLLGATRFGYLRVERFYMFSFIQEDMLAPYFKISSDFNTFIHIDA